MVSQNTGTELNHEFYKIIVDRFDPKTVYLAVEGRGVLISKDAGASWNPWNDGLTNKAPGARNNVTNTLALSADHSILYFGSFGSGVFRRMITPVLPVNNLYATVKNHQIRLNWQFDDLNNNFNHYNIYRSTTDFSSTLVNMEKQGGYYNIIWDGRNDQGQSVATGTYFYEMRIGDFRQKRKVVFLK
ncbi:hypothetical protein H8E88_07890 [candidate division KSB1 bacterium]|nr:hypothetical protein [candidate division KSB1 bacterium]